MIAGDWIALIAILLCLAISFVFSGSETALTASSRARMLRLEKHGNQRAAIVMRELEGGSYAEIAEVLPDVLVKGADWSHFIAGREEVEAAGGRVLTVSLEPGYSTTNLVERMTSQP